MKSGLTPYGQLLSLFLTLYLYISIEKLKGRNDKTYQLSFTALQQLCFSVPLLDSTHTSKQKYFPYHHDKKLSIISSSCAKIKEFI